MRLSTSSVDFGRFVVSSKPLGFLVSCRVRDLYKQRVMHEDDFQGCRRYRNVKQSHVSLSLQSSIGKRVDEN